MRRLIHFILAICLLFVSLWTLVKAPNATYIVISATIGAFTSVYLIIVTLLRKAEELDKPSRTIWSLNNLYCVVLGLFIFELILAQLAIADIIHENFNSIEFLVGSIALTIALFVINGQFKRVFQLLRQTKK